MDKRCRFSAIFTEITYCLLLAHQPPSNKECTAKRKSSRLQKKFSPLIADRRDKICWQILSFEVYHSPLSYTLIPEIFEWYWVQSNVPNVHDLGSNWHLFRQGTITKVRCLIILTSSMGIIESLCLSNELMPGMVPSPLHFKHGHFQFEWCMVSFIIFFHKLLYVIITMQVPCRHRLLRSLGPRL